MTKQKLRAPLALSRKLALENKMDIENISRELPNLSGAVVRDERPAQRIRTWRERIGQTAEFPLHLATDVERAMVAEIAELRAAQSAGEATSTLGELLTSVGGWMNGGELGYPSFGSMDALRIFTQRSIHAALAAAPLPQVQSEALDALIAQHRIAVTPEYEGGFQAEVYRNREEPASRGYGTTPRAAVDAALADQQPVTPSGALADNGGGVKT